MNKGKLYRISDNELVAEVNYQLHHESEVNWWGELTLATYERLNEGEGFVIELEDNRMGRCRLRKRINRAVSGVPPRYVYHFNGTSPLE